MPEIMQNKRMKNFRMLEELQVLSFKRAMMPEDAANFRARLIVLVDPKVLTMTVYISFERIGG
jgi:hypothetical protein